jgi:cysteine synthase
MNLTLDALYADPVFAALNPAGKQFLRGRNLPRELNPFIQDGIDITALLTFGEFSHVKTVPSFQMMLEDFKSGKYRGKDTVVVDSSGNTGWAIARLAVAYGLNMKVVLSADVPSSKQGIFRALSTVEIINVPKGQSVSARAKEEAEKPGHYHLDQYSHRGNMLGHELYTGPEIARVLDGNIGIIAIAMGSGGTVAGVGKFLKENCPEAMVVGVRPMIGQQVPGARDEKKMREVVTLPWEKVVDAVVDVSRKDAFVAMRRLWSAVEPQPGPTSGLAYFGLLKFLKDLETMPNGLELFIGKKIAFLCPDSATLYSDVIVSELDTGQGL